MLKKILVSLALLFAPTGAFAQSSPNFTTNQKVTADQWNSEFSSKADVNNGSLSNPSITGGHIDNTPIGGTTPGAGTFSSLSATSGGTLSGTFAGSPIFSGDTTVGTSTAAARLSLNGPSGASTRSIRWQTAGVNRWSLLPSSTAEAATVTTTTTGAVLVGNLVIPVTSATGITAGMQISVAGIPSTAYVVSVSGLNVTASTPTTGSGIASGATVNFIPNTGADMTWNALNDAGGSWLTPLSITRSTGVVSLNNGWKISNTFSPLTSTTMQHGFFASESWIGSLTGGDQRYNEILINSDTLGLSAGNVATFFRVGGNWGGTGFNGARNGFVASLQQAGGALTLTGPAPMVASTGMSIANANLGGTAFTNTNTKGSVFAFSGYCELVTAATFYNEAGCQENDVAIDSGSSAAISLAYSAVHLAAHATPGAVFDSAYSASDQFGSVGWTGPIYSIGRPDGVWPCNTSGCDLFGVVATDPSFLKSGGALRPMKATNGLNIRAVNFTGNSIQVPGLEQTGAGALNVSSFRVTPSTSGVSLDVPDQILSTVAVSSGASGTGGCYQTNDILIDIYGDQFTGTAAACVLTGLSVAVRGHTNSPPGAPVTLTGGSGYGATATLTFTAANTLTLNPSGGLLKTGSGTWSANGAVATALTSIGPTGSHTTVQEWFTVTDSAGVVRYIPGF